MAGKAKVSPIAERDVPSNPRLQGPTHHNGNRIISYFGQQGVLLAQTYSMLARRGAVHLQRARDHVFDRKFGLGGFFRYGLVVGDIFVEIAVANVTFDTGVETKFLRFVLAGLDDVGQPAERDGNISVPCNVVLVSANAA